MRQDEINRRRALLGEPLPLVSVIVPTRDRADLLERCADGLLEQTDYPAIELLIVDNDSEEPATRRLFERLARDSRVRILSVAGDFNYSVLNNQAAREARGEVLLLLNNDIEVIEPNWLRVMVRLAMRPDIGAVGAKLIYPDGRVQHAGVVMTEGGTPEHEFRFADRFDTGPNGELARTRDVLAVTGACVAMRRSVFEEVGGLRLEFAVAFGDIDLCLRIGDHGYRIVWSPLAELVHVESASRGCDSETEAKRERCAREETHFRRFWGSVVASDPQGDPAFGTDPTGLRLARVVRRLSETRSALEDANARAETARVREHEALSRAERAEALHRALVSSTTWRMTLPLRVAGERLGGRWLGFARKQR